MRLLPLSLMFLLFISNLNAAIYNVPRDFGTIQAAVNNSEDYDTVLVHPGEYVERFVYNGINVCVGSLFLTSGDTAYIGSTLLRGGGNGRAVTFMNDENRHARLCGFTITEGSVINGGAVYCNQADPTLDHLVITGNSVSEDGGGIYCENHSLPLISDCTVYDNHAGEHGGGIYFRDDSDPILLNVIVRDNDAGSGGGFYFNFDCEPQLTNVQVINNSAETMGGGIVINGRCNVTMTGVAIAGNFAGSLYGGGMYIGASDVDMENVTLADNVTNGSGGGFRMLGACEINIHNSIIWNNRPDQGYQSGSPNPAGEIDVSYSDVTAGRNGIVITGNASYGWHDGNIDDDPLFVDAENRDYRLTRRSPCIDAGDPVSPEDSDGSHADMGAFEFDHRVEVRDRNNLFLPVELNLLASPNPFNSSTLISYNVNAARDVKLMLTDMLGRRVNTWIYNHQNAGKYSFVLDGRDLTSGTYMLKFESGERFATQKLICIK